MMHVSSGIHSPWSFSAVKQELAQRICGQFSTQAGQYMGQSLVHLMQLACNFFPCGHRKQQGWEDAGKGR